MARPLPVLALLAATALPGRLGAQAFEGTLRMRTVKVDVTPLLEQYGNDPDKLIAAPWERIMAAARDAGGNVDEDSGAYHIKDSRFRVSGGSFAPNAYMVMDVKTGAGLMVQPAERTYMAWTSEDSKRMRDEMRAMMREAQEPGQPAPAEFEPLGTTRELRSRRCAEYKLTEEQVTTIACLTKDLPALASIFQQWGEIEMGSGEKGPENQILQLTRHGFPLLVRELTIEGDEETRTAVYEISEFISIDRGTLPESLFAPPPGFRKTTLPGSP